MVGLEGYLEAVRDYLSLQRGSECWLTYKKLAYHRGVRMTSGYVSALRWLLENERYVVDRLGRRWVLVKTVKHPRARKRWTMVFALDGFHD